jgi:hypothetical protein
MRTLTAALVCLLALASLPGTSVPLFPDASHAQARLAASSLLDGDKKGGGDDGGDKGGDDDDDDEDFRVVG